MSKKTPRRVATRGFGVSTPRFGSVGSIYNNSSPVALPRSDFDVEKVKTRHQVASIKKSSRSDWMKQKKQDTEASHQLSSVRSDFDKTKGCTMKTSSKRFEGPNSYVKKKTYDAGLGMSHGKLTTQGMVSMKREKHSRFSVYGNIYDSVKINDVGPISPPRLLDESSYEKPSAVFRKSKKEKGRDAWMKQKKKSQDNEADHRLADVRSDFDMTKTNKSSVKMSRRGKHGRFSMLGGIYSSSKNNNHVVPSTIKSTFDNDDEDKPSAVFVNSKKENDRSSWMLKKKDQTEASHRLGVVQSDFDKMTDEENAKPSSAFVGTKSRFDMPGSHFKKNLGTSPKSDALGLVHSNVVTKDLKGAVKMKRGKHGRFSMLGSIYNS